MMTEQDISARQVMIDPQTRTCFSLLGVPKIQGNSTGARHATKQGKPRYLLQTRSAIQASILNCTSWTKDSKAAPRRKGWLKLWTWRVLASRGNKRKAEDPHLAPQASKRIKGRG